MNSGPAKFVKYSSAFLFPLKLFTKTRSGLRTKTSKLLQLTEYKFDENKKDKTSLNRHQPDQNELTFNHTCE